MQIDQTVEQPVTMTCTHHQGEDAHTGAPPGGQCAPLSQNPGSLMASAVVVVGAPPSSAASGQ